MSLHASARRLLVALAILTIPASLSAQARRSGDVAASQSLVLGTERVERAAAAEGVGSSPAPRAEGLAPRRDASVAGVRRQETADTPRPVALAPTRGRGQTLAIVGGAAFIGGLLIGDDVGTAIAVGGLATGVYGLWLWLK